MTTQARYVIWDVETQSEADLKTVGARKYIAHHSFRTLTAVFAPAWDDSIVMWAVHQPMPDIVAAWVSDNVYFVGHNAIKFDRLAWQREHAEGRWPAPPADDHIIDTMHIASILAFPELSLEAVQHALAVGDKDKAGNDLAKKLNKLTKAGRLPEPTAEQMERLMEYNVNDVLGTRDIWLKMFHRFAHYEHDIRVLDTRINDRGIPLDLRMVNKVKLFDEKLREETVTAARTFTREELQSRQKFREKIILAAPELSDCLHDVRKETLISVRAIAPETVHKPIDARISLAATASKKCKKMEDLTGVDGMCRDQLQYHAAHTGRWGGRGAQPQNLPRPGKVDMDRLIRTFESDEAYPGYLIECRAMKVSPDEAIKAALRPCIRAASGRTFVIADYSNIEARVLAQIAGQKDAIDRFRRNEDPYVAFANALFKTDIRLLEPATYKKWRDLAKAAVLGLGYQMGKDKFKSTAESQYGIKWQDMPVLPETVVQTWRESNPEIVKLWYWLQDTGRSVAKPVDKTERVSFGMDKVEITSTLGEEQQTIFGRWEYDPKYMTMQLPSGRHIFYNDPQFVFAFTKNKQGKVERNEHLLFGIRPSSEESKAFKYKLDDGSYITAHKLYGGIFTENLVQATARDILCDALLRCDKAGLDIVFHVHDEIIIETDKAKAKETQKQLEEIMKQPPAWMPDLPLGVESEISERYRK